MTVLVEEIGGKIETHESLAVWLLAQRHAVGDSDPATGGWVDLSRYFSRVRDAQPARDHELSAPGRPPPTTPSRLTGYQSDVLLQVQAIYDALKQDADITYVNSLIAFNPEESARTSACTLRESLEEHQANCMDGTLLFASLLEAATINRPS